MYYIKLWKGEKHVNKIKASFIGIFGAYNACGAPCRYGCGGA
jgi:hypothetical protein